MRYAIPTFLALCLLLAPAPAVADDSKPATLKELGRALSELAKRVEALVQEANKDPDERNIEIYEKYTPEQLKLRKRAVRASMLIEYMVDPGKNFLVRQRAQKAVLEGAQFRGDPDFSRTEKQAGKSKRAYFSEKFLIKNLGHEDAKARKLTSDMLNKLWRVHTVSAIIGYNVNDKNTWKKAVGAWRKYLRKQ